MPHCSIISYCLMPNHFHFLIYSNENTMREVSHNAVIARNVFSDGVRMLLSSYAKAINKQEGKTGNLFQQKTKAKSLSLDEIYPGMILQSSVYEEDCFNYIHYNPVKAGLVMHPSEWKFSSYNEYFNSSGYGICDTELGVKLLSMLFELTPSNVDL